VRAQTTPASPDPGPIAPLTAQPPGGATPAVAPEPEPAPIAPIEPTTAPALDAAATHEETASAPAEKQVDADPKLHIGVGLRAGLKYDPVVGGPGEVTVDRMNVRPYLSGQVNDYIGFEANLDGTTAGIAVLDAVAKFHFDDLANIWAGQFRPPSERSNLSGAYRLNGWNPPSATHAFPSDTNGRDRGAAFWGQVKGGVFKYQVGLFDLEPGNPVKSSRFALRLVGNFLDPEPGYYNASTYYGEKEVLALGGTLQYQNEPTPDVDDKLFAWQLDVLYETKMSPSGVVSLEGAYWNFKGTDDAYTNAFVAGGPATPIFTRPGQSFYLLAAWMTPKKIGIGNIQPNVRIEYLQLDLPDAAPAGTPDLDASEKLDLGVNYIIDGHNLRLAAVFSHMFNPGLAADANAFQLGTQIQL
jgi:hypothetical protein